MSSSAPKGRAHHIPSLLRALGRYSGGLLLIGPALIVLGHFVYAALNHDLFFHDGARIVRYYVGPLLIAAVYLIVVWWTTAATRTALAANAYAVIGALVLFEIYSDQAAPRPAPGAKVAEITALRAAGRDAYPAFPVREVNDLIGADSRESAAVSNLPDVTTVLCKNGDGWIWFDSDGEGFNNPVERHVGAGRVALPVALIGDSFIHGVCLPREETIVGQLRRGGVAARSFGILSHGPLFELEILKRHVYRHEPRDVVWCFYEGNDIQDLEAESEIPWLVEAIDSGPLDLAPQAARRVQRSIRTALDAQIATGRFAPTEPSEMSWTSVLGLRRSSLVMGLHYGRAPTPASLELFGRVMRSAKETVEGWGGRLHLCYLPDYARYAGLLPARGAHDAFKERILGVARDLDIDIIDVSARFHDHASPTGLFDERTIHYTREGAALTAKAIADALPAPDVVASGR